MTKHRISRKSCLKQDFSFINDSQSTSKLLTWKQIIKEFKVGYFAADDDDLYELGLAPELGIIKEKRLRYSVWGCVFLFDKNSRIWAIVGLITWGKSSTSLEFLPDDWEGSGKIRTKKRGKIKVTTYDSINVAYKDEEVFTYQCGIVPYQKEAMINYYWGPEEKLYKFKLI